MESLYSISFVVVKIADRHCNGAINAVELSLIQFLTYITYLQISLITQARNIWKLSSCAKVESQQGYFAKTVTR